MVLEILRIFGISSSWLLPRRRTSIFQHKLKYMSLIWLILFHAKFNSLSVLLTHERDGVLTRLFREMFKYCNLFNSLKARSCVSTISFFDNSNLCKENHVVNWRQHWWICDFTASISEQIIVTADLVSEQLLTSLLSNVVILAGYYVKWDKQRNCGPGDAVITLIMPALSWLVAPGFVALTTNGAISGNLFGVMVVLGFQWSSDWLMCSCG